MKFIKKNIDALEPRDSKYYVMDDALEDFGIKVYPSGKKSFIVRLRFGSSKKEKVIKDITLTSISDARRTAGEYIDQYKKGVDVTKEEKKKVVKNKSLKKCIEDYLKTVKTGTHKSVNEAKLIWDDKPLRNISSLMVLKLYDERVKISFHGARQEAAYLRAIWNQNKKELNLDDSPTLILNEDRKGWNKKTTKHRRLDHETAIEWSKAIETVSTRDKSMFKLVYFTGLRAGEAMSLEWDNINFKNTSLHIPDTKNGKPLDIPLNSQAIAVLESIKSGKYKHKKYIFPQVDQKGKVTAMKYYSKSLAKLKKQGVNWSPHDSRRGFINAGGVTGCNSYMVKQLVNHTDSTEAHDGYHYYTLGELRPATQTIGDHLNNQLSSSNVVVEFKKKA